MSLLPGKESSLCHEQGGDSQLIGVCPDFPNTRLSQGSSAVGESAGCNGEVKIPLFASLHFISSSLANESCYEMLFFLSLSDELIGNPIKCSTRQMSSMRLPLSDSLSELLHHF